MFTSSLLPQRDIIKFFLPLSLRIATNRPESTALKFHNAPYWDGDGRRKESWRGGGVSHRTSSCFISGMAPFPHFMKRFSDDLRFFPPRASASLCGVFFPRAISFIMRTSKKDKRWKERAGRWEAIRIFISNLPREIPFSYDSVLRDVIARDYTVVEQRSEAICPLSITFRNSIKFLIRPGIFKAFVCSSYKWCLVKLGYVTQTPELHLFCHFLEKLDRH